MRGQVADSEQVLRDKMAIIRGSRAFGVDTPITPQLTGDEGGETPCSEVDRYSTSSYTLDQETTHDNGQHSSLFSFYSTWNGLANPSSLVFPSDDGCVHAPSLSIDTIASPLTPESLIEVYNITKGLHQQDDFSFKCIDPRLLCIAHPADNFSIETPHALTLDTQPNLGIFPSPTSGPVTPAHRDGNYTAITPTSHQIPSPLSEALAHRARPIPNRGRNDSIRKQNLSPRHKKRRAKALEGFSQLSFYHSLPTADREYLYQVVTNLSNAPHLVSPQSLEPTVGSFDGRLLIGPRRLIGPGAAAAHESVYAVLVDRPSEGPYMCWICGEARADRRLNRALDHVRGHFNHRPYRCSETHFDQRTEPASPLPLGPVCGQSFTCAEALKDHQTKMKNKGHTCEVCGKIYSNSANLKRHERNEHSIGSAEAIHLSISINASY